MKLNIKSELERIRKQLKATRQQMAKKKAELLETMGVQLLADAQLDYLTKSKGGTGKDGVSWKPLHELTIKRKNRRGLNQTGTAAKRAQKLVDQKKRGRPSKKVKDAKSFLQNSQSTDIGVDTGLQRASASPGFIGPDGKGGNFFEQDETSVTVGYNREYSKYFDEARPLLPDELPQEWQEHQEQIVTDWAEKLLEEGIGGI